MKNTKKLYKSYRKEYTLEPKWNQLTKLEKKDWKRIKKRFKKSTK